MDELIEACMKANRIFIYGAGRNAERIFEYLMDHKIKIEGFIVTSLIGNPDYLHGVAVIDIYNYLNYSGDLIICSMVPKSNAYRMVFDKLVGLKIKNVFYISEAEKIFLDKWVNEVSEAALDVFFNTGIYHYEKAVPVERYHYIFSQKINNCSDYHWRMSRYYLDKSRDRKIEDFFSDKSAIKEFEAIYGCYIPINQVIDKKQNTEISCNIYMACSEHDRWALKDGIDPWLVPIQVGAKFADDIICSFCDDTGNNISERNRNWSEGTAIYWMWKNASVCDYIGLCHYRRRLRLKAEQISALNKNGINVIVTSPTFVLDSTREFLGSIAPDSDFEILVKTVNEISPAYSEAVKTFLNARFYPPCNLFLMKWDVFKSYGDFVFPICLAVDEYYESIGYRRRDRYMGYLLEVLLGVFLIKNKNELNVAYTEMEFLSTESR